jgi:tetraacyldisaccharide 4'-kinase
MPTSVFSRAAPTPSPTPGDWRLSLQRSWSRRGLLNCALLPLTLAYWLASGLRKLMFRLGLLQSETLGAPVIVVGNLVAGGAGKTPTVIALVHALKARGYRPGIISRGHGSSASAARPVLEQSAARDVGDEPALLQRRTGIPVWVGRQRAQAGRALLQAHPEVDLLISDDGLQHLALARQAEVIVIDERGLGNGWLLPAGPLRERPPKRLAVHTQVLYNSNFPSTHLPGWTATRSLSGVLPLAQWRDGGHAAPHWSALQATPLWAVAGIAQPGRFFDALAEKGLTFQTLILPDHHPYTNAPWPEGAVDVVITEKDAVKIPDSFAAPSPGQPRVWVAVLEFEIPTPMVDALLASTQSRPS